MVSVVIAKVEILTIKEELYSVLIPVTRVAYLNAATIGVGPGEDDTVSH
jgi:hypothetical protein